ncbi:hypothetical protein ACF07Y_42695 [Streptomyces sp. NPDC016566]|uniref:hypothetical protein n=1 Tax=Streptomyces sp. NPDC016566 TaxID=3364967 RepID=UPI0036F5EEE8
MPIGIVAILIPVIVAVIGWYVLALIENHKTDKRDLEKIAEVLSKIDLIVRDLKELQRAATVLELNDLRVLIKEVERGADQCTGDLQARMRTIAGLLRKYVEATAPAVDEVCAAYLAVSRAEDVPTELTVEFLVARSEEQALLRPQLEAAVAGAEMKIRRMRRLRLGV